MKIEKSEGLERDLGDEHVGVSVSAGSSHPAVAPNYVPPPPPKYVPPPIPPPAPSSAEQYHPPDPSATPPPDPYANLKQTPEYQQTCDDIALLDRLAYGKAGLGQIDSGFGDAFGGGKDDGKIDLGNIRDAMNNSSDPEVRATAKMLNDNPNLFHEIDTNGDGLITMDEVKKLLDTKKSHKTDLENAAVGKTTANTQTSNTTPGNGAPAGNTNTQPDSGTDKAGGTGADKNPATGTGDTTPTKFSQDPSGAAQIPNFSSTKTGPGLVDDASGYLSNTIDGIDQLLAKEAAANPPNQGRITVLQNQRAKFAFGQQALMSLQQQQFEMMSNMAKMYAEMAKNAIGNMR